MACHPGYKKVEDSNFVCKLNKSLYGLKQCSHAWYGKLRFYLISYNFKVNNADHSLFSKRTCDFTIIVLVYVDDIIITDNSMVEIKRVKSQLKENSDIKNLGVLKYFLEIEVAHSPKGLFISQIKYILDLLKKTDKLGCKPVSIPIDNKIN
jgi:Reverse transcriptase (RNA-dependent DNA polymerase)